jgi:hypothetical protein
VDHRILPGVGFSRLLRRGGGYHGVRQACGAVERITPSARRARPAVMIGGAIRRRDRRERTTMVLSFPNKSRAFDATRRAVRFWGHDSAMEVAFFITEDALKRVEPQMRFDEAGLLRAFNSHRDLICATAAKVYKRRRKGSYDLVGSDF